VSLFRVVVAGRPNVGKSALANRLARRRRSLVHNLPGVTRDVLEVEAHLPDGRAYTLFDTGGYDPEGREDIPKSVRDKAVAAIRTADMVLLVIDASAGVLPGDRAAARAIREAGRDAVVVANKIDRKEGREGEPEAWALGFSEVYGTSAEHGEGVDDVQAAIAARMSAVAPANTGAMADAGPGEADESAEAPAGAEAEPREIALAVVGRPNVGKSSLVNALLGEERAIVSPIAGTTRDSVDVVLAHGGKVIRLVDTAGIRRKGRTERGPEVLSVVQARKRIEECDVAVLVLDAAEGPTGQDATVASYANDEGKGLVLVGNKWDIAGPAAEDAARKFEEALHLEIPFARSAPVILVSALTGRGVGKVLDAAVRVAENRRRRIATGELNRVLGRALRDKEPRTAKGKRLRILYVAQTGVAPPTFNLVANGADRLHFSEERRIENLIRGMADFTGSPIRIKTRGRSGHERREHHRKGRGESKVQSPRNKDGSPKSKVQGPKSRGGTRKATGGKARAKRGDRGTKHGRKSGSSR
jgi:GTP-binding protein